ncbi:MAG: hypothetical protein GY765_16575, partial [bacterium]|nr:hypothetical protein [bacterium]
RRKSGKTAIVQRIFNRLWDENGAIIPFYYTIPEKKMWYPYFAIDFYRTFASQYISFLERNEMPVRTPLKLEEIREYGAKNAINLLVSDVDEIRHYQSEGGHDLVWKTAYTAPERFAAVFDRRILVMIDEFQNISQYVYRDESCNTAPDETLAGSFHDVVESKIAPMLVTGSYVGWLIMVIDNYLEAGRLKRYFMDPYLA